MEAVTGLSVSRHWGACFRQVMVALASAVVYLTGLYFLALGVGSLFAPALVRRFLLGFAATRGAVRAGARGPSLRWPLMLLPGGRREATGSHAGTQDAMMGVRWPKSGTAVRATGEP